MHILHFLFLFPFQASNSLKNNLRNVHNTKFPHKATPREGITDYNQYNSGDFANKGI